MGRRWLLLLVVAAAVIAAVLAVSRAFDGGDSTEPATGTHEEREREGIVIKLSVDKEEYDVGEQVSARAEVRNGRNDGLTYQGGLLLQAVSVLGGAQPLAPDGDSPPAQGALGSGDTLKAGGKWDQQIAFQADPLQAPDGEYSIQATFQALLQGRAEPLLVQAVVRFKLKGGAFILDPLSVLTAAVNDEEFLRWMEGRARNVVCAYSTNGLFYQGFTPSKTAAETFDFIYKAQVEGGLPICGIGTDGEAWRLNFYSAIGDPPRRVNLVMELDDAAVIRFEEVPEPSGTAPTPTPVPSP